MILLDISQLCLSSSFAFSDQLKQSTGDKEKSKDILRHIILSCVKSYKKKFEQQYGDVVICCDHRHYWRRDVFPEYKYLRKKARESSDLDWRLIFDTINEVTEDLKQYFPYKVICVDGAESDDVIAVITESFSKDDNAQPILIVSSDKDFLQLHRFVNVRQISPQTKKFIETEDSEMYLREKIIRGDKGDGIPNIFSQADVFVIGIKQIAVTKKKLEQFIAVSDSQQIEDKFICENYKRNQQLIDFNFIPNNIRAAILQQFEAPVIGDKTKIFDYLVNHRCSALLNDIESF